MKHSLKLVALCLFAALGLLMQGCGPETTLTGIVSEAETGSPVPGAAVLGMVWIEEADKAKPAVETDTMNAVERDTAYEKDVAERGLPVAYARGFTGEKGWFKLDKLYFSSETKKAIKAMKQPRVTRVTLCAFQRGYLKRAVTAFPKDEKEMPDATIILNKPLNWKELSEDSSFSSLERPEYYNGFSKAFGATKEEKNWFLEYTHSNLYKAYADSDIKGHKEWEAYCGHDYSDVIVSSAGIYRNPKREKCAELLKRLGAVRENEEFWANHSLKPTEWAETAKGLIQEAITGLAAGNSEPKKYEREILAGMEAGEKNLESAVAANWLEASKARLEEAKLLYGKGDKPAAYRALGQALHARVRTVPADVQIIKLVTAIQDALTGFQQLMNRPLTAQLPNGDNANHKDKPGYNVEGATETVTIYRTITTLPVPANQGKSIRLFNVNEISPSSVTSPTPEREYIHGAENQDVFALVDSGELDFSSATVSFFDSKGNQRGMWTNKPGEIRHWEFSRDGRYFLVTMWPLPSEQIQTETPLETRIVPTFILNSSGTVLHQFESSLEPIFMFAPSGNYLYRYLKDGFEIFELDGTLKWEHKCLAGPYISRNDAYIVSLETKTKLAIYNIAGKLLNIIEVPEFNADKLQPSVRTVSDDGDIFVYFESNVKKLIALDRNGKIIKRLLLKEFPSSPRFADNEKNEVIIDLWEHIKPGEDHKREIKLR